jgi:hypothetical protein
MILTEACAFAFCRIWRCRLQESLGGSNERLEADDMFDKGWQETTRIVPVLPSSDLERVAQELENALFKLSAQARWCPKSKRLTT